MKNIIDISIPLNMETPVWEGTNAPNIVQTGFMEKGDKSNLSEVKMGLHAGTHVDAPLHFVADGKSIDHVDLEKFCGRVYVAEIRGATNITAELLDAAGIPEDAERLLLKTDNCAIWEKGSSGFVRDYAALDLSGAEWVASRGMKLVGADYLSATVFEGIEKSHAVLLGAEVVLLEGITLNHVEPGWYELICLPLFISGAEASPVRAVLVRG